MYLTLGAAVRNYAIPSTAPRLQASNPDHSAQASGSVKTSHLLALPRKLWSLKQSCTKRAYTKKTYTAKTPVVQATSFMYMNTTFKDAAKENNHRRRSRVLVRCEMAPKGREPSPGHDEQHQQHCKYPKREDGHSDHHSPGRDEQQHHEHHQQHHSHPGERKAFNKRSEEDPKPGSEWHDIFHSELREWKGLRGPKNEEQGEEEDPYPEYTPRHGSDNEGRACSTLKESGKGYVIKVSKELMGLFCYIEKRKRSMIKELAHTLRQVAVVAMVLTCVRGVFAPLVEVFKTSPPSWSKLLLMLVSLDSVAICYLTIKSAEPLEQLAALATENRQNIMEGVEKEEEMILKIAIEFIRLFKRLRNIAITLTVSQTAQLFLTVLKMKDPEFVINVVRIVQSWMQSPWS